MTRAPDPVPAPVTLPVTTESSIDDRIDAVDAVDAVLPQTQCTRCGFPDCRSYARAIVIDGAGIGRCPPGGAEGVRRLAAVTGQPVVPLDPAHGTEGPRRLALIDEAWCIGCTLCIKACPVDCIIGAPKAMHTVVDSECTGCDLCAPACPVDCIAMVDSGDPRTGWQAWSPAQADAARAAYLARNARRAHDAKDRAAERESHAQHTLEHLAETTHAPDDASLARKRAVIEAALARARGARQRPSGGP